MVDLPEINDLIKILSDHQFGYIGFRRCWQYNEDRDIFYMINLDGDSLALTHQEAKDIAEYLIKNGNISGDLLGSFPKYGSITI